MSPSRKTVYHEYILSSTYFYANLSQNFIHTSVFLPKIELNLCSKDPFSPQNPKIIRLATPV